MDVLEAPAMKFPMSLAVPRHCCVLISLGGPMHNSDKITAHARILLFARGGNRISQPPLHLSTWRLSPGASRPHQTGRNLFSSC